MSSPSPVPDAIAEIEELPLAERADRYLVLLEELRRRLEDADSADR
jgi:hypothetical protein